MRRKFVIWWDGYGIQAKQMGVLVVTTVVGSWAVQQESVDRYEFEIRILVWGRDEDVEQKTNPTFDIKRFIHKQFAPICTLCGKPTPFSSSRLPGRCESFPEETGFEGTKPAVPPGSLAYVVRAGDGAQRYGPPREVESSGPVEAGPGACTFDSRHLYTKKVCGEGSIRAVSYNILADTYAQTEFSRTVLYPYCAPYALELDYRQNLLKKELAGYSADLICLQEVDKSVFVDSLAPALDAFGLEGLFKIKEKQHEGLATFYRRDKFSLLSQHDIAFSEALLSDPLHKELCDKLAEYPLVQEKVLQRSSVLQVSVLQSTTDPSRKICVANTHLYWHPKGGNIRLIQIAVALSHIKHVACDLYPSIPIIFCGDFNSTPSSGTYSFINSGGIAEDHEDWVSNGEEERCNMPLSHSFKLLSACGEPAYTNYVGGFHGCLDYIFIDKNALEVEQVIPLPSHEEVTTHQALPSVSHPSDHIALICDLKWK
ncbi:PREDICTED: 2',5'-phosphodiesterase 12 [Aptenodytes forsteri]|uniref:2',5'-phosphodiesterase 12 n=1 Tax=Aptenodytes forsteri TaxID=9233 RepID=UPI0004F449F1|nr:PREDICTED: 2',5'-phosphodiesterase 12 [Aptenodytes forsteri]